MNVLNGHFSFIMRYLCSMSQMNEIQKEDFRKLSSKYTADERYAVLKDYIAHGKVTVYEHSLSVARESFKLNRKLKLNCDEETLIAGALLHDYYLYDWHDAPINVPLFKMHGYTHPFTASDNACKTFGADKKVQSIIKSHMWPLTLRTIPSSKEAWLVCICDKIVALKETFRRS